MIGVCLIDIDDEVIFAEVFKFIDGVDIKAAYFRKSIIEFIINYFSWFEVLDDSGARR